MQLAFLGTGLMGTPMVRNLLKAGFPVRVWNRSPEKAQVLAADGADIAQSASEAIAGADIVFTMLSDGNAVNALLNSRGVLAAFRTGAVFIDMSSIRPDQAREHAKLLAGYEVDAIDAPVSGGTRGAENATLAIMAGGSEAGFETARPALEALGRPVRVGPAGTGQLAKLANQGIVATTIGAVAEAMLLMKTGGADVSRFRDALRGGFADSVILQQHGQRMEEENFTPGGRSSLQLKDLVNLLREAESLGLVLPLAELQKERFATLVNSQGGADLDHSALFLELAARQPGSRK